MKILKRVLIALNILAFLLVAYVFVVVVVMPVNKAFLPITKLEQPVEKVTKSKKKSAQKVVAKSPKKSSQNDDSNVETSALDENVSSADLQSRFDSLSILRKQAAFLSARYELSKQDSIYLVVDLIDSVASLEVKGVSVHKARILGVDVSHSLKLFHAKDFSLWLEYPFELKSATATIPKYPIVVKNAPKDTLEAAKQEAVPTIPHREDVFITMNFTKNLRVVLSQAEQLDSIGKIRIDSLKWEKRKTHLNKAYQSLTTFQYDKISPFINIKLSKVDVTIIYRALPDKPQMVLRM